MSPTYPVGYESDFIEGRSRLTTFFRPLLAIPHFIVLAVVTIACAVAVVCAWFAIVFTGRYPEGLYKFVASVVQYGVRVQGYLLLAADPFPKFSLGVDPDYPVRLPIGPAKESYSRAKTFFRVIVAIPVMLINYALTIVAEVAALIAWFWIVITGKQNAGLQGAIDLGLAYIGRSNAYFSLLTEDWPPFSPQGTEQLGPDPTGSLPPTTSSGPDASREPAGTAGTQA